MNSQNSERGSVSDVAEVEDLKLTDSAQGKSYSQSRLVMRRFFRHGPAMTSLVILFATSVLAFSAAGIGPIAGWWDEPYRLQPGATTYNGGEPTWFSDEGILGPHPFGQDGLPRDYFARVMRGTSNSLIIAFTIAIVSSVIGIALGAIAGFFRGWIESVIMRLTDFVIVVPVIMLAAILGPLAGSNIWILALILGCVTWTSMARLVRAEVLALREREFVAAAVAMGASASRIIFKHMIPNSIGVIIVNLSFAVAAGVLLESSLSYLGLGVRSPEVSLGMLIESNEQAMNTRPHLFWFPAFFIVLIALTVNFIGDGLRDAFDPRRQRTGDRRPDLLSVLGLRGLSIAIERRKRANRERDYATRREPDDSAATDDQGRTP
ncbi:ABC transporter permease [Nesterenkonia salmonea]|nr:ABC transporter permease [Nesterenkonia salmonea]